MTKSTDEEYDATEAYKSYFEYNKVLRTWFVAFGIGGPALFLVNEKIATALYEAGNLKLVALLFLGGAASQIFGSLINKIANWYVFMGSIDESYRTRLALKASEWIIEQFWIDILLDLVTIISFGVAIWNMMTIFGTSN